MIVIIYSEYISFSRKLWMQFAFNFELNEQRSNAPYQFPMRVTRCQSDDFECTHGNSIKMQKRRYHWGRLKSEM